MVVRSMNECNTKHTSPSSIFSLAHVCPLRLVIERNAIELSLDPPRYFDEVLVPFPATIVEVALVVTPASPESLVLLRVPESINNLLEIWKQMGQILRITSKSLSQK